ALLHVADELIDLLGGRARRVIERDRNFRPSRLGDILREDATADDGQRERSHRSEQPAKHACAKPDVEAIEGARNNRRQRRRIRRGFVKQWSGGIASLRLLHAADSLRETMIRTGGGYWRSHDRNGPSIGRPCGLKLTPDL